MDPYGTLNVSRDATPAEIAKAYKRAALACHPDRHPDDPEAGKKFDKLSKAYQLLSNPVTRASFDEQGIEVKFEGDIDFRTLFARFFDGCDFGDGVPDLFDSLPKEAFTIKTTITTRNVDGSTKVETSGSGGVGNSSRADRLRKQAEQEERQRAEAERLEGLERKRQQAEAMQKERQRAQPTHIVVQVYGQPLPICAEGFLHKKVNGGFHLVDPTELGDMLLSGVQLNEKNFYYAIQDPKTGRRVFYTPEKVSRM